MKTLLPLLREYSMGSDHERHLLCAALYPNQSRFQHGRSGSCNRSATDKPMGLVQKLGQPVVGSPTKRLVSARCTTAQVPSRV